MTRPATSISRGNRGRCAEDDDYNRSCYNPAARLKSIRERFQMLRKGGVVLCEMCKGKGIYGLDLRTTALRKTRDKS